MASSVLIENAHTVATMDADRRVLRDASIYIENEQIVEVGVSTESDHDADTVIDATNMVVLPGLVNTHHHFYQCLNRNIPAVQDAKLFDWLVTLYEIWREYDAYAVYLSAKVALAELILSGCTTASDHYYVFPEGTSDLILAEVRAAEELGVRFHPCRGSMSRGRSDGGLPPDDVVQSEAEILRDSRALIESIHDPSDFSMCRLVLAPCSPFSVTTELMRETRALAKEHAVHCHTHLAETLDEEQFCLELFGKRPLAYMEEVDWIGPDVWFAHAVHMNADEIALLAETGTGVAHCPSSNMRLGSGIAPVKPMIDAGVPVSLAVDGSASNDSSHLLAEARHAMLLQRVQYGVDALSATQALELATIGGAQVLGRDDIGTIEPGMGADIIGFDLNAIGYTGALHDPVAALVFCAPRQVAFSVINGSVVVEDGAIVGLDTDALMAKANTLAGELVSKAEANTGRDFSSLRWTRAFG